jgi:hypothetical protein
MLKSILGMATLCAIAIGMALVPQLFGSASRSFCVTGSDTDGVLVNTTQKPSYHHAVLLQMVANDSKAIFLRTPETSGSRNVTRVMDASDPSMIHRTTAKSAIVGQLATQFNRRVTDYRAVGALVAVCMRDANQCEKRESAAWEQLRAAKSHHTSFRRKMIDNLETAYKSHLPVDFLPPSPLCRDLDYECDEPQKSQSQLYIFAILAGILSVLILAKSFHGKGGCDYWKRPLPPIPTAEVAAAAWAMARIIESPAHTDTRLTYCREFETLNDDGSRIAKERDDIRLHFEGHVATLNEQEAKLNYQSTLESITKEHVRVVEDFEDQIAELQSSLNRQSDGKTTLFR